MKLRVSYGGLSGYHDQIKIIRQEIRKGKIIARIKNLVTFSLQGSAIIAMSFRSTMIDSTDPSESEFRSCRKLRSG